MSERVRIGRGPLLVVCLALAALLSAGCGSGSSSASASGDSLCGQWCGSGSATVTLQGSTGTIHGGGCYDGGSAGVDARFGDWQDLTGGLGGYLQLIAYRTGGATPTPATTPNNPPAAPTATDHLSPTVAGSLGGQPFILGNDAAVTLDANGKGTFSGTDVNGLGAVKGTFTCD